MSDEADFNPPDASDVARRAVILKYQFEYSASIPPPDVVAQMTADRRAFERRLDEGRRRMIAELRGSGLWEDASPRERVLFEQRPSGITKRQVIDASWRAESVHCLAWALELVDEIPDYETQTDPEILMPLIPTAHVSDFCRSAQLRGRDMIEGAPRRGMSGMRRRRIPRKRTTVDRIHMRSIFCVAVLALLPTYAPQPTKYAIFWAWFRAHSDRLHAVRSPTDPLLDSLGAALARVHPRVTYELGPAEANRELVLSADGIREAFPEVQALAAAAPRLAGWRITKFRPRRQPLNVLTLDRLSVDPKRVRFLLAQDEPGKVGILLFLEGYTEQQREIYTKAAFLLLDEALGEYDMETRVGAIELRATGAEGAEDSRPLTTLAAAFESWFARPNRD